jgi:hypothetical protein
MSLLSIYYRIVKISSQVQILNPTSQILVSSTSHSAFYPPKFSTVLNFQSPSQHSRSMLNL